MVAVELDEERLFALRDPDRGKLDSPIRSGLLPWLMALLERSVGSLTDVFPGSEMLEAVDEAERVGAKTIMIDRPIQSILKEIRRGSSAGETEDRLRRTGSSLRNIHETADYSAEEVGPRRANHGIRSKVSNTLSNSSQRERSIHGR